MPCLPTPPFFRAVLIEPQSSMVQHRSIRGVRYTPCLKKDRIVRFSFLTNFIPPIPLNTANTASHPQYIMNDCHFIERTNTNKVSTQKIVDENIRPRFATKYGVSCSSNVAMTKRDSDKF